MSLRTSLLTTTLAIILALIADLSHAQRGHGAAAKGGTPRAAAPSLGRRKVEDAVAYQSKLADSSVTMSEVIKNWQDVVGDADVKKDVDALAIAYGSLGLLLAQDGQKAIADSTLAYAIPLFRLKHSKAYFLVSFANLDRELHRYSRALDSYKEIITTLDSMAELWDIDFYRLSGYAPYAYAIDASHGTMTIAETDKTYRKRAIAILSAALDRHPSDALGLFEMVALKRLGVMKPERYAFKTKELYSRKPELRAVGEKFEKELKQ